MNTTNKTLLASFVIVALAVAAPMAAAQTTFTFGSYVKLGDADFAPTLVAAGASTVCRINLGDTASLNDDQFVLDFAGALAPANDQVRLVNQGTAKAGTLIGDDAASGNEKASGFAGACSALVLIDIDVDGDGVWGPGDYLYVDTSGVAGVTGGIGVSAQDIRLTVTSGGAAGTITKPGDSDVTAFGAAGAAGFGPAALNFWDQDLDTVWSSGDALYASTGAGAPAAPLAIVHDVRLVGGSGAFGSFVKLGDADFAPTVAASAVPNVCRVNLGDTASVNDDQFMLDFTALAAAPINDNVRLVNQGASKAGTLVGDDAASGNEKASGFVACDGGLTLISIDVDGDGVWGTGDYLYVDTTGIGGLGAAGLSAADVRLTVTSGGAAATITKPGDSDVTAFGGAVGGIGPAATSFWDQDLDAVWSAGDGLYASTTPAGPLAIVHDVRLVGTSGAFGSSVKLGDADFASTLAAAAVPNVCRVNLGDTASVNDDQFMLDFTAAAAAPINDNVRLVNQGASKAGTLVGDDAASGNEKASGFVACDGGLTLISIDVDGDGVWGTGDYLYVDTTGIGGLGAAGLSAADVRLTVTSGGAAATITKPGDSDVTAFGGAVGGIGPAALAFWDQDLDAVWSAGDSLYASTTPAGPLAIVHDVRLTGVFAPGGGIPGGSTGPGTTGPGTTGPGTTGPGTTGPGTTGPGTTAQPTSDDDETDAPEDKDEETPGFELVALLAALGAALVLVRRKL